MAVVGTTFIGHLIWNFGAGSESFLVEASDESLVLSDPGCLCLSLGRLG